MQVFVPYPEPIKVAQCLDKKRLNKQIIECKQIFTAMNEGGAWSNHPVTKMYRDYFGWLDNYLKCLWCYQHGNIRDAEWYSDMADKFHRPSFLTEEFCNQHKRRLYTKEKEYYKQFAEYGESEINWYFVDGELLKYKNGKRVER